MNKKSMLDNENNASSKYTIEVLAAIIGVAVSSTVSTLVLTDVAQATRDSAGEEWAWGGDPGSGYCAISKSWFYGMNYGTWAHGASVMHVLWGSMGGTWAWMAMYADSHVYNWGTIDASVGLGMTDIAWVDGWGDHGCWWGWRGLSSVYPSDRTSSGSAWTGGWTYTYSVYAYTSWSWNWMASEAASGINIWNTWWLSYSNSGLSGAGSAASSTRAWITGTITASWSHPSAPTGYNAADCWWTSSSGGSRYWPGTAYWGGLDGTAAGCYNKTAYAHWSKQTFTISYNANGGSGAPSSQTKTYGQTLTLSSTKPTRSNSYASDGSYYYYYTFKGWSTSSSATSPTYYAGGSYTANSAATLYAVWSSTKVYLTKSITLYGNGGTIGGSTSRTITATYGKLLPTTDSSGNSLSSMVPVRTGYTFLGMYNSQLSDTYPTPSVISGGVKSTFKAIDEDDNSVITTYTFIEGWTWQDFIDSTYSNGDFEASGSYVGYNSSPYIDRSLLYSGNSVKLTDEIYAGNYTVSSDCCFYPGTQILASLDGTVKNIEHFEIGDSVVVQNVTTGEIFTTYTFKPAHVHSNTIHVAKITFEDNSIIQLNAYHPLLSIDGYKSLTGWGGCPILEDGDMIIRADGSTQKVRNIEIEVLDEGIDTYNLILFDPINDGAFLSSDYVYFANGYAVHTGIAAYDDEDEYRAQRRQKRCIHKNLYEDFDVDNATDSEFIVFCTNIKNKNEAAYCEFYRYWITAKQYARFVKLVSHIQ